MVGSGWSNVARNLEKGRSLALATRRRERKINSVIEICVWVSDPKQVPFLTLTLPLEILVLDRSAFPPVTLRSCIR